MRWGSTLKGGGRMTPKKKTEKQQVYYDILSGPGRDKLFDSVKYAYDDDSYIAVTFSIANGYSMPKGHPGCAYIPMVIDKVRITSLTHEDGSGYNFLITGFCQADLNIFGNDPIPYRFNAFFNAKARKGWITFTE